MKRKLILIMVGLAALVTAQAQDFAVKTNLLYDATATVNVGAEVGFAPRWTFDLSGNYNAWSISERKLKHWMVQPEFRYWFCERFQDHFIAVHALGGQYNVGFIPNDLNVLGKDLSVLSDHRFQGFFAGAGIAYGYAWALTEHLNLEFELGVGYVYTRYDEFECFGCGKKIAEDVPVNYVGPTKAAIGLVYVF